MVKTRIYNLVDGKWQLVNELEEQNENALKNIIYLHFYKIGKVMLTRGTANGCTNFKILLERGNIGTTHDIKYEYDNVQLNVY